MEVKYLKAHNGKYPGDTSVVKDGLGKYLVAMNVAVEESAKIQKPDADIEVVKPKRARKNIED